MRKRSVWVEPLFGEAKEFHRLRRLRLRRLLKVNIEGVMVATGQNLKRLIKHNLNMLFSFLESTFSKLIQSPNTHFFNRLNHFATQNQPHLNLFALYNKSFEAKQNWQPNL